MTRYIRCRTWSVGKGRPLPAPSEGSGLVGIYVLGGVEDKLVDVEGVREMASHCGVEPVPVKGLAHDVMIDTKWEVAAKEMWNWLERIGLGDDLRS